MGILLNSLGKNRSALANADVIIGGKTDGIFLPNVNSRKWDNEAWLNLNPKWFKVDKNTVYSTDGNVHRLQNNSLIWQSYITSGGGVENEIVFAVNPGINKIEFDIADSGNLRYERQETLDTDWLTSIERIWGQTLEEYKAHRRRPENVIGSYAVFLDGKRDNKYETGKAFHIFRPKLIDSLGNVRWLEQHIVGNKLTIGLDFTGLVFPVILDPELGYSTAGASEMEDPVTWRGNSYTTDGSGGTITNFHVYASASTAADYVKVGVYPTGGDQNPNGESLVESAIIDVSNAAHGDLKSVAGVGGSLSASTEYCLPWISSDYGCGVCYDTSTGNTGYAYRTSTTYAAEFVDPCVATGTTPTQNAWSVWVDYTSGGGGVDVTITGVSSTTKVGALISTGGAIVNLSGVSSAALAGTMSVVLTSGVTVGLVGAQATGQVGALIAAGGSIVPLDGVSASSLIGDMTITTGAIVPLIGAMSTSQVGTISATGGATLTINGVSATGQVGTITIDIAGSVSVTLSRIVSTGRAGDLAVTTGAVVSLDGAAAAGSAGVMGIQAGALIGVIGVSSTGSVGDLAVTGGASVTLPGVNSSAIVGMIDITTAATVTLTGVMATGRVGTVTVTAGAPIQIPGYRVYTVENEDRVYMIVEEDRVMAINNDDRIFPIN